jgi:DNA-binding response OmpR family regulator
MDGLELLQQLRAATGMQELPAIFLSARVDRETVEAAHRLGAAYLAKPFMEEILYAAIEAALTRGYEGLWTAVEAAKHRSPTLDANGPLEDKRGAQGRGHCCVNASIVISGPAVMLR